MKSTSEISMLEDADGASKVATTNFYGMDTTRDHLCGLIRKRHSLIDVQCECKTSDGFLLRFFVICFTARAKKQCKATTFAQRSQIKQIRAIIKKILMTTCVKSTLKELVNKVLGSGITMEMESKCKKIYPIENCTIRKIKTVKRPRFDMAQLLSMQADSEVAGDKKEETTKEEKKETTDSNLVQ